MDFIEIQFWKLAKYLIRRGYVVDCSNYDNHCPSCRAKEVIEWIDGHIALIKN